ncbi:MAG: UDP-N-acetylmuramoyl-L-alanine--D-glutamate ligase [Clostridiales bacterium]|nr:UDP-N-acetylmuramoyl-L-alanine--D-glutamate ligase [Clostridiales bacterium]
MNYKGKKVLIMGMQASGISAGFLLNKLGAEVFYYDDNTKINITDFTNVTNNASEILTTIDLIVASPAIPSKHHVIKDAVSRNIKIISELELGCRHLNCPIIMVTGTNGKTTVITMIEKLLLSFGLKVKAMGNVGYPVSQVVLDQTLLDYAVVEASSFQLGYIETVKPYIAVVMNLAPDHLDRYDSYAGYVNDKKNIIKNQTESDYIFINNDDAICRQFGKESKARIIAISPHITQTEVYIKDNYFMFNDTSLCHIRECKLRGEHNRFNLLVALNIGALLGAKREHLANLIKDYSTLPNRLEYVSTLNGISYYNDSKSTNIHSCKYAIFSLEGDIGLIMGGSDKNEDFCEFFENIDEKVKAIAVCGSNAQKIFNSALKMGYTDIKVFTSLKEALHFLNTKKVQNVLFSPCSASFDRYKNYAERGEYFKSLVYEINI